MKNICLRKSEKGGIKENCFWLYDKSYFGYEIVKWLKGAKIRCKKSTYSNYQYIINSKIIPKFAHIKKKSVTSEIIDSYTTDLLAEGLLPKTVKDILILLQQIVRAAGLNVCVVMPKVPKNEIHILKKDEQISLEQVLLENLNLTTFGIYFTLYTGLRIGELCALKWDSIDLENQKMVIRKTITRIKNPDFDENKKTLVVIDDPKSLASIREIPIPRFIVPILKTMNGNDNPNNYLLTGTESFVETRTFFNRYKKILKKANLESYNFHALRHTFATRCVEHGCDPKTLSEILGHSNVKITLERYVHPDYESKVILMNNLKPMYF